MNGKHRLGPVFRRLLASLAFFSLAPYALESAANQPAPGCILPPQQTLIRNILDSLESRLISERAISNVQGEPYREVDVGISGQVEGCTLIDLPAPTVFRHLVDGPDLWFQQPHSYLSDDPLRPTELGLVYRGVARFDVTDGSGMTVLYPESPAAWNGKLWIVQHGNGVYLPLGELVPRAPETSFTPRMSRNLYAALMVDKGYAVAWIRKDHAGATPVTRVHLDDGTAVTRALLDHASLELALTKHAQRFIEERLGERPKRTYFYGFSGGGQTGRLMNYVPEANVDADGTRIVDGFLIDDAGGGQPLPILFRGGADVLLATAGDQGNFAPQIDITHVLYRPEMYLVRKRENARLLLEKGLGDKHRVYEVLGVSHVFTAGALDLGGLMEAMIDILDQWVEEAIAPPSSYAHGVAGISRPPIALPEIACPLGIHYTYPDDAPNEGRATQTTNFAPFDGTGLEPLDWRGELVDMNENRVRDERESVDAAWRRLGLLGAKEPFTSQRYAACVEEAAVGLAEERLLPWRVVEHYRSQAARVAPGE